MNKWMVVALMVTLVGGAYAHCGSCPGDTKETAKASCTTTNTTCTAKKTACSKSKDATCAAKKTCSQKQTECTKEAAAKKCCGGAKQ